MSLIVSEIYRSIQGESSHAGWPCVFVRLTGCPLRCRWCDTVHAFSGGQEYSIVKIIDEVSAFGVPMVEVTGGEPLAQKETPELIAALINAKFQVLIETSGAISIGKLPEKLHIVMDIKCPDSGMAEHNDWSNIELLKPTDDVKFVVASREDFDWTCKIISEYQLETRCNVLLSCAFGLIEPAKLVEWLLESGLNARLNLQQHKYIWHPRKKGV